MAGEAHHRVRIHPRADQVANTSKPTRSSAPPGPGSTSFFVTDAPDRFVRIGQRFLGARVESAVPIER
jgi:hypothetical protein